MSARVKDWVPEPEVRDDKLVYTLICQYEPCGAQFEASRSDAKYHHPRCRRRAWRQRRNADRS